MTEQAMHNSIHILLMVLAGTLLFASRAMAYLDPVSTSFIINSVGAAVFGAAFYVKLRGHKLKDLVRGKNARAEIKPVEK